MTMGTGPNLNNTLLSEQPPGQFIETSEPAVGALVPGARHCRSCQKDFFNPDTPLCTNCGSLDTNSLLGDIVDHG